MLSCNELAVDDRRGGGGQSPSKSQPWPAGEPSDVDAEDGAGAGARAAVPIGDAAWPMLRCTMAPPESFHAAGLCLAFLLLHALRDVRLARWLERELIIWNGHEQCKANDSDTLQPLQRS